MQDYDDLIGAISSKQPVRLAYDIETAPLPDDQLLRFFVPPIPAEFDPAAVKIGNLIDPAKIAAKIAAARAKHAAEAPTEEDAFDTFRNEAPLSALYGRVCAIGYGVCQPDGSAEAFLDIAWPPSEEEHMLVRWWNVVVECRRRHGQLISFNGERFDLPFLTRRSWAHGMRPPSLRDKYNKWDSSIDLRNHWCMGDYTQKGKLDDIARCFGLGGKLEGVTGAGFWKLLRDSQFGIAADYLRSDITATAAVAHRILGPAA